MHGSRTSLRRRPLNTLVPQDYIDLHALVDKENPQSYLAAGKDLYRRITGSAPAMDRDQATGLLSAHFYALLNANHYDLAALLALGPLVFNPNARSVQRIWSAMNKRPKLLLMGGGSQGKTYSPSVKLWLRWEEDQEGTTVKLVSTSGGHATSNIFAGFIRFRKESIIPLPGILREDYIGIDKDARRSSIAKVSIPDGDDGKAALRGFHPLPRGKRHPKFGDYTACFCMLDEAEGVPSGGFIGVDNMMSTLGGSGQVQAIAATNPMFISSEFAIRAEPLYGWDTIDREEAEEWEGQQGYYVLRLDPKKTENIVERREVCPGHLTFEAYQAYEEKGLNHPDYWTFARGMYPFESAIYSIIYPYYLDGSRAVYNFAEGPINVGSLDPAFEEGGDDPTLTTGRYGLANGIVVDGGIEYFPERYVLQVEQQFPMLRRDTSDMADDVIDICKGLHIRPEWFCLDATGNGTGVRDLLLRRFGPILALMWGNAATDKKILDEDTQVANELYSGLASEMWFAMARWLEFGYVKFAPSLQTHRLFSEFTARKFEYVSKTLRKAESKAKFKKGNGGRSCDYADSCVQLVHICRMRGQDRPAMLPPEPKRQKPSLWDFGPPKQNVDKPYPWVKV